MLEPGSVRIDEAIAVATARTTRAQVEYLRTQEWTREAVETAARVEHLADDLAVLTATATAQARAADAVRRRLGGVAVMLGRSVSVIERSRALRAASESAGRAALAGMPREKLAAAAARGDERA
jgi:hypothetical protein